MEKYQQLLDILTDAEADMSRFYQSQNKAAGTRARKKMQDIKQLAQDIRLDVQKQKTENQ